MITNIMITMKIHRVGVFVIGEPQQQFSFARGGVPDQQQLEKVVAANADSGFDTTCTLGETHCSGFCKRPLRVTVLGLTGINFVYECPP